MGAICRCTRGNKMGKHDGACCPASCRKARKSDRERNKPPVSSFYCTADSEIASTIVKSIIHLTHNYPKKIPFNVPNITVPITIFSRLHLNSLTVAIWRPTFSIKAATSGRTLKRGGGTETAIYGGQAARKGRRVAKLICLFLNIFVGRKSLYYFIIDVKA